MRYSVTLPDGTKAWRSKPVYEQHVHTATVVRKSVAWVESFVNADDYELLYANGELIPQEHWAKLLGAKTFVMHCERFDLYYMQLIQRDTLVLVGPTPQPVKTKPTAKEVSP